MNVHYKVPGSLLFSLYIQVLAPGCGSSSLCQGSFYNSFQTITGFNLLISFQVFHKYLCDICIPSELYTIGGKKIIALFILPERSVN